MPRAAVGGGSRLIRSRIRRARRTGRRSRCRPIPLGVARGQVAATYIVAEAEDGLVIVDQHAAHERLVLERMRAAREGGAIARQPLLMPEVVELDEPDCDRLEGAADELAGARP